MRPAWSLPLALVPLLAGCARDTPTPSPGPETEAGDTGPARPAPTRGAAIPFDAARAWADLERTVALGPRHPGSQALAELVDLLEAELTVLGFTTRRETFEVEVPVTPSTPEGKLTYTNLIADLPAAEAEAPMVLVGGHIDTKFLGADFVGANDGGSSTAVLLELGRGLAASGPRAATWRLAFFDGEEAVRRDWVGNDNTYGSRRHAIELCKRGEDRRVGAVVVVDMVADRDLTLTWDDYSTAWVRQVFWEAARAEGLESSVGRPSRGTLVKDDHLPFLDLDLPAVDLIDLDYGGPMRPWWHTSADTLDKCSQESLARFGRLLTRGLVDLELRVLQNAR